MTPPPSQGSTTPNRTPIQNLQEEISPLRPPIQWDLTSPVPIPYQHLGPPPQYNMQAAQPSAQPVAEVAGAPGDNQLIVHARTRPRSPSAPDIPSDSRVVTVSVGSDSLGSPPAKRHCPNISIPRRDGAGLPAQLSAQSLPVAFDEQPQYVSLSEITLTQSFSRRLFTQAPLGLAGSTRSVTPHRKGLLSTLQHTSPRNLPSYGNISGALPVSFSRCATAQVPRRPSSSRCSQSRQGERRPRAPLYTGILVSQANGRDTIISGTNIPFDSINSFLRRFARLNDCQGPNPKYPYKGQVHRNAMRSITQLTMEWQSIGTHFTNMYAILLSKDKGAKIGIAIFSRAQELNMLYLIDEIRAYFEDLATRMSAEYDKLKVDRAEVRSCMEIRYYSRVGTFLMDRAFFGAITDAISALKRHILAEKQVIDEKDMRVETNGQEAVRKTQRLAVKQTSIAGDQVKKSPTKPAAMGEKGKEVV